MNDYDPPPTPPSTLHEGYPGCDRDGAIGVLVLGVVVGGALIMAMAG